MLFNISITCMQRWIRWIKIYKQDAEYCKQLSSVNNIQNLVTALTWIKNSSGPSTEPWGTPALIGAVEENTIINIK